MHALTIINGLGSVGLSPVRAFVPAFLMAMLLRFGPENEWLAETGVFQWISGTPTWFTHDITLVVLGILSAVEIIATKSPEVRELLLDVDKYIKFVANVLTQLGVISAADAEFVEQSIQQAGFGDLIIVLPIGAFVFFMSALRSQFLRPLLEADEDDDMRIQSLLSWLEDFWVVIGTFVLIVFPFLMLLGIAATTAVLFVVRKRLERREELAKSPCGQCGEPIYPSSIACPSCLATNPSPSDIGFLGQAMNRPANDLRSHAYKLTEKKRCPICAARLKKSHPVQECQSCSHDLMSNGAFADGYFLNIKNRLPKVLAISCLLGFIPFFGMVAAFVYYRTLIVSPFRRYIPRGRRTLVKWLMRFVRYCAFVLQIIPFVGGFVVLGLAGLEYFTYRNVFQSILVQEPQKRKNNSIDV